MTKITLSADRMLHRLPLYWHNYDEMVAYLHALGVEIDSQNEEKGYILVDSFILEMREERVKEWERWLKIPAQGTLEERRLAILNYFGRITKMSRESIQAIVAAMYDGAKAEVTFHDSTIFVMVKPLKGKPDIFVHRWKDILKWFDTWGDLYRSGGQWGSMPLYGDLYWVLYERKPCHIHLVTSRYMPDWHEVNFAENWGEVNANTANWAELRLKTWEQ